MHDRDARNDGAGRGRVRPLGGLGRRLLLWLLVLALVPLFVSNTIGYLRSDDIIEGLVERYMKGIVSVQALHVRDQVERGVLNLQAVAAGNEFLVAAALRGRGISGGPMGELADADRAVAHLRSKLAELTAFAALYVYAPDGRVLVAATDPDAGADLPHVLSHPTETLSVHRNSHLDGAPWLRIAVPLRGDGGSPAGYLGGTISLENPNDFLEIPAHVAGSIESFVVDDLGRPLFISHAHGYARYDEPLATPLLDRPAGSAARYRDREGVEVIGLSAPIPGRSWRFVSEVPVTDALGPLQALRRLSILLEVFMGLLVVTVAWLVARGIVAPVARLVAATREVGAGRLATRVRVTETDEIGELARAFNDMTAELERSDRRIRELHGREIERAGQLATVGELASGLAHEIKNPVVGISNGLDLVMRRARGDATLEPIADEIRHQLHRIESAVRDMLAFARPAEPTPARIDPNAVAERALRLVQPVADKARVRVETELSDGVPRVWADEEMVGQAVVNLTMNAVQATPPGGSVSVRTAARGEWVELVVGDTGAGIPADARDRIFKPFFTTKHQGSGLGLSITRSIVERHGGTIDVASDVGRGATFTVRLPVDGPAAEPPDRGAASSGEVSR